MTSIAYDLAFGDTSQTQIAPEDNLSIEPNVPEFGYTKEQLDALPSEDLYQYYGISSQGNALSFSQLYKKMQGDNLNTNRQYEVQQEWLKEAYRDLDYMADPRQKAKHRALLKQIEADPRMFKENTIGNQVGEAWDRNKHAAAGQMERIYDGIANRIDTSDREIFEKYDPELLALADKNGGLEHLLNAGQAVKLQEHDLSGVGSMMGFGATLEERKLGEQLYDRLQALRSRETLNRADQEASEIQMIDKDGNVKTVKVSNMHAAGYFANAASGIAGNKEAAEYFDENPWTSLFKPSQYGYMLNSTLSSTVQNLPTFAGGTIAGLLSGGTASMLVMNSANMIQQEFQAVQDAISAEYKKLHGENANVFALSPKDYLAFTQELADKGVITKESDEGIKTGILMTIAGSAVGSAVAKVGTKALMSGSAARAKGEIMKALAISATGAALHFTDEGLQEVAETIVENVRKGKNPMEGLSQAFILGTFSPENLSQKGSPVVGKGIRKVLGKKKEEEAPQDNDTDKLPGGGDDDKENGTTEALKPMEDSGHKPKKVKTSDETAGDATVVEETPTQDNNALFKEFDSLARIEKPTPEQITRMQEIEDSIPGFTNEYITWLKNKGNTNESGTTNRDGGANANGQTDGQGVNEPDTSGTQRSDETGEQVSPTETETATAGHSKSNTQPTADLTGEPNDNTQTSDATRTDGRTREADGRPMEQGEPRADGEQQNSEPTQTAPQSSTDTGVQQRTESDSSGETLEQRRDRLRAEKAEHDRTQQEELANKEAEYNRANAEYQKAKAKYDKDSADYNAKVADISRRRSRGERVAPYETDLHVPVAPTKPKALDLTPKPFAKQAELDQAEAEYTKANTINVKPLSDIDKQTVDAIKRTLYNREGNLTAEDARSMLERRKNTLPEATYNELSEQIAKRETHNKAVSEFLSTPKAKRDKNSLTKKALAKEAESLSNKVKSLISGSNSKAEVDRIVNHFDTVRTSHANNYVASIESAATKRKAEIDNELGALPGNKSVTKPTQTTEDTSPISKPQVEPTTDNGTQADTVTPKSSKPKKTKPKKETTSQETKGETGTKANETPSKPTKKTIFDLTDEDVQGKKGTLKSIWELANEAVNADKSNIGKVRAKATELSKAWGAKEKTITLYSGSFDKRHNVEASKPKTEDKPTSTPNKPTNHVQDPVNRGEAAALANIAESKKVADIIAKVRDLDNNGRAKALHKLYHDGEIIKAELLAVVKALNTNAYSVPESQVEAIIRGWRKYSTHNDEHKKLKKKYPNMAGVDYDGDPVDNKGNKLNKQIVSNSTKDSKYWLARYKALSVEVISKYPDYQQKSILSTTGVHSVEQLVNEWYSVSWQLDRVTYRDIMSDVTLNLFDEQVKAYVDGSTTYKEIIGSVKIVLSLEQAKREKQYNRYKKSLGILFEDISKRTGIPLSRFTTDFKPKNSGGYHDPNTGKIAVASTESVADVLDTLRHEIGHLFTAYTVDGKDYHKLMAKFRTNPFVNSLLNSKISEQYAKTGTGIDLRTEEILVDMYAAIRVGSWDYFAKRYQIKVEDIPADIKNNKDNFITRTYDALKAIIANFLGKSTITDSDVRNFLEHLDFVDDVHERTSGKWRDVKDTVIYNRAIAQGFTHDQAIAYIVRMRVDDGLDNDLSANKKSELATALLQQDDFIDNADKIRQEANVKDNAELVDLAIDPDYKANLPEKSLLRKFLDKLSKFVYGITAVASIGAMTIPTDAMAQQGFATYTQGTPIKGVSQEVSNTANWVMANKDHNGKNFVVADKENGKIHVFDKDGKLQHSQNAIFGKSKRNDNSLGSTPSGRFLLTKTDAKNLTQKDIQVFGDSVLDLTNPKTGSLVKSADGRVIAMHRVINTPERTKALDTAKASDNYLSNGCINIPTAFYNSAADNLNGAMFYVLDHSNENAQANSQAKTQSKTSQTKSGAYKTDNKSYKFSTTVTPANLSKMETTLTKEKVDKKLSRTLGKYAKNVTLITKEEYGKHPNFERVIKAGIEGLYDPKTGNVYIVADNIQDANGIKAEDRLAWVAWHELTHRGLDVKFGKDLQAQLEFASTNPFVQDLADAIQAERLASGSTVAVSDSRAIEEALSEINAAIQTKNMKALADRYGVRIPSYFSDNGSTFFQMAMEKLRKLFRTVLGKPTLTHKQLSDLLQTLPMEVATHAEPEAKMIIEALNNFDNRLVNGYDSAYKFSMKDWGKSLRNGIQDFVEGLTSNEKPLDTAGGNASVLDPSKTSVQETKHSLTWRERLIEQITDSDMPWIKYVGGLGTDIAQQIKRAKSAIAGNMRKNLHAVETLREAYQKKANEMVKLGLYKRDERHQIDTDIQLLNTAFAAITRSKKGKDIIPNENEALMQKYRDELDGYTVTLSDGTQVHKQGLKAQVKDFQNQIIGTPLEGHAYLTKRLNELNGRMNKYIAILAKSEEDKNVLLSDKVAGNNELENFRGHNGMNYASAYRQISLLVKAGRINVEYDGKPWADYIADVGFDPHTGFKDTDQNTDYALDYDKLKIDGHLAGLMQQSVDLAKEFYEQQRQALGKELVGVSTDNPFFTPTMGQPKAFKTGHNLNETTEKQIFKLNDDGTIQEMLRDAEVAEWQHTKLGRATLGAGSLLNLQSLANITAKRIGWNEVGKQMYKDGQNKKYNTRVVNTADPTFEATKGILIAVPKAKGSKEMKYIKVSFDSDKANEALFGDNVDSEVGPILRVVGALTRFFSIGLTFTPMFAMYNAYRGLREKHTQIKAWGDDTELGRYWKSKLSPEYQKKLQGLTGVQFASELLGMTISRLTKGILGGGYIGATLAMALDLGDRKPTTSKFRDLLLSTNAAKETYAKLKAIQAMGGISTRAEGMQYTPEQLQKMFSKGGVTTWVAKKSEAFLDRSMTLTTMFELMSTLATVETLHGDMNNSQDKGMGMELKDAVSANLHFMNFNDRGSSKTMAIARSTLPFVNATTQGARGVYRVGTSVNGWKNIIRSSIGSMVFMALSDLLQRMYPCETDVNGTPFRDKNSAELMREIPFRIGCSGELRIPVAYGMDMISHTLGVSAYQWAMGNWDLKQSGKALWHAIAENASPLPATPGRYDGILGLIEPMIPKPARDIISIASDMDDFGNRLSRMGADDKQFKFMHGKDTTAPFWSGFAEILYEAGPNLTPEQAKHFWKSFLPFGDYSANLIDALSKDLKEDQTRAGQVLYSLLGGRTAFRQARTPGSKAFTEVSNNLERYNHITEEIKKGLEDPNDKLKLGTKTTNTQSWLKRRLADGTFKESEAERVKIILDYYKQVDRIGKKKIPKEKKDELYYENNAKYLRLMHALEDKK